ncbi:unnamed protein product, partial [Didymodactylos carnosus]
MYEIFSWFSVLGEYLGFRYYCLRKNDDDSKYWKCVKKSCRVGLTIKPDGTIKKRADHDHLPNEA